MAKKLSQEDWLTIKTRYQMGDAMRAISRDYGIPDSTIHARKTKEGWTQKLSTQISDIKEKIIEIEQNVEHPAQFEIIEKRIKSEIDDQLAIARSIMNLDKGALNLHAMILKKTIAEAGSGSMTPQQAASVLATSGLKVDQIAARAGITSNNPTANVQINNNNDDGSAVIKLVR